MDVTHKHPYIVLMIRNQIRSAIAFLVIRSFWGYNKTMGKPSKIRSRWPLYLGTISSVLIWVDWVDLTFELHKPEFLKPWLPILDTPLNHQQPFYVVWYAYILHRCLLRFVRELAKQLWMISARNAFQGCGKIQVYRRSIISGWGCAWVNKQNVWLASVFRAHS